MTVSNTQVTCPKCRTTLRPAKPLPPGKQVKCPKCGTTFISPGADPDEAGVEEAPVKKKAGSAKAAPGGPAAKKPKPNKPGGPPKAKPAAPAKPAKRTDDEDEGGTYGFVQEDKAKEEEEKPDINYAPDTSLKDLRGPAQSAIMGPSNKLMFVGCIGFLGWLAALVVMLIPVLFPVQDTTTEQDKDKDKQAATSNASSSASSSSANSSGGEAGKKKKEEHKRSFFDIGDIPLSKIADMPWYLIILSLPLPAILGMMYAAAIAFGAVKMQELESRGWGLTSSIMALFPINTGGAALVVVLFFQMLMGMVLDFDWFLYSVLLGMAGLMWLIQLVIGITGLMTLMKPEVIAGFEFKPE